MGIVMPLQMERRYRQIQGGYKHICTSVLATCDAFEGFHILTYVIQLHKHLVPLLRTTYELRDCSQPYLH